MGKLVQETLSILGYESMNDFIQDQLPSLLATKILLHAFLYNKDKEIHAKKILKEWEEKMDIKNMSKEELLVLRETYQKKLDEISKPDSFITSIHDAYKLSKKIEEIDLLLK